MKYLLFLILSVHTIACFSQAIDRPYPFTVINKDRSIIVPDSLVGEISYSLIVVELILNKKGIKKSYKILNVKLNSTHNIIDYLNEDISHGKTKDNLSRLGIFLPYIEKKIQNTKIVKNKYSKPENENKGFLIFELVNMKKNKK